MIGVLKGLVQKEFREAIRDRRAIMAGLFAIFMGPVMMAGIILFQIDEVTEIKPTYVEFTGAEHAPSLISFLASQKVLPRDKITEDEVAKWAKMPITFTIPDDYATNMAQGKPITLIINADFSNKNLMKPLRRFEKIIAQYSRSIGSTRLLMRGIDPRITNPLLLNTQDTATPESKSGLMMGMLAMFILMSLFTASMTAAIDTSAGERERHSLELILCQPVPTSMVVLSKVLMVSAYGTIASIITMIAMTFTMSALPLEKLGMSVMVDFSTMALIAIMIIPLGYLAGIFQLFFAYRAKSFKEAQSYLSMILLLPMMVPMVITFLPHKPLWLDYVPLAGQHLIMEALYKGEGVNWPAYVITALVTTVVAFVMTAILAKSLKSEKVVLGLS